jgi:hypothetical protein
MWWSEGIGCREQKDRAHLLSLENVNELELLFESAEQLIFLLCELFVFGAQSIHLCIALLTRA